MTELVVVSGDITSLTVDAMVTAANPSLLGGGGVDGAIHRAGGPTIVAECRAIVALRGECQPGHAVSTGAGDLAARWVVHTVGPVYTDADAVHHDLTLTSAYRRSVEVASDLGAGTVAFPNISTGVYGFPKARAAPIAIETVGAAARGSSIEKVIFVCHDDENRRLYEALLTLR